MILASSTFGMGFAAAILLGAVLLLIAVAAKIWNDRELP